jgi:carotenoid cleavage dioxygenase-like enzyme
MGLLSLERRVGYIEGGDVEDKKSGTTNTAFTHYEGQTYALEESCYPFKINVDKNAKKFDIKSIGYDDFEEQLKHNVSAHPKVDKKKNELLTFGYDIEGASISYSLFNKDRKLLINTLIPIESPRMIHDFMITENYVIIPDSPLKFNPEATVKDSKFIF